MRPLISIITPTVRRPSLEKCCDSVNEQVYPHWEHIVVDDRGFRDSRGPIEDPNWNRLWLACDNAHRNGGNSCRALGWEQAKGDYVYYLDDDNYMADPQALDRIAMSLSDNPPWILVPIHRHGSRFYFDPPKPCYFDTGNAVVRREIAQWPNINDYASDGVWLTETLLKHPYKALPQLKPVMVMPATSFGAGGGINGQ